MVSGTCGWAGRSGCRGWIWFLGLCRIHNPMEHSVSPTFEVLMDKKYHKRSDALNFSQPLI